MPLQDDELNRLWIETAERALTLGITFEDFLDDAAKYYDYCESHRIDVWL